MTPGIDPVRYVGNRNARLNEDDWNEFCNLVMSKETLESQVQLRKLRDDVETLNRKLSRKQETVEDMIEVGKVVIKPVSNKVIDGFARQNKEESITVLMDDSHITLRQGDGRLYLSPEKTIELAQLLMKAAECQSEYAAAARELEEQKKRLDAKYKDMISGLGLENPDLNGKTLPQQSWSGVSKR